jgi:hypothetical protein
MNLSWSIGSLESRSTRRGDLAHVQNRIDGEFVASPNIPRTSFLEDPTHRPSREPNSVVDIEGAAGRSCFNSRAVYKT